MLIERRGLTTPERVNKVISGEKLGTDISSRFLQRLQKTAGFGTTAVVGKAVIQQVFIRQMPASIRAHLATTPDSTSLESLAVLADRAIASENEVKDNSVGVAEVRVNDSEKLIEIMEDMSRRLKKLETSEHQKKHYNNVMTETSKLSPSRLLYVTDKRNKCRYLIDTGAAVSVLPRSCANGTVDADSLPLVAANNSTITTYGTSKRMVDVGLKREYSWTFIVADVKQRILGADFLIHYNLLVDLSGRCLRDMRTGLAIAGPLSSIKLLSLNRIDSTRNEYTELLNQFPELTRPTMKGETVKRGITHKIVTKGHPVFVRPRRLAPDKLVTANREFDEMIKLGVIEPSDSEWSSALHMVSKKKRRLATMRRLSQLKCSNGSR